MLRQTRRAALLATSLLITLSTSAMAQPSPSDGVRLPDRSMTIQSDAASVEVNPAGLGFMKTVELGYTAQLAAPDSAGVVDEGHALFAAAGFGGLGLGFGAQWLTRPDLGAGLTRFRKYTFAGALGLGDDLSIGLGYHLFGSDNNATLDAMQSVDLGLQWRFGEHLGISAFGRDLNAPFIDGNTALARRLGAAVALRLWDGRLVFEQEIQHVRRSEQFSLVPRIAIEPIEGLRLFGRAEIMATSGSSAGASGLVAATAGMELTLGFIGAQSGLHMGTINDQRKLTGHSHSVWISPDKQRALFDLTKEWILIDVSTPFAELPISGLFGPSAQSYIKLLLDLDRMARDSSVEGVVLNIAGVGMGYGQLWEVRQRLDALRKAGKPIVAVLQSSDTRSIYLANAADKLYMPPHATYEPAGLSAQLISYGGLLERFKIKSEFLRVRDYKTAPEQYTNLKPSPESLEQTGDYIEAIFNAFLDSFQSRKTTRQAAQEIVDRVPLLPLEAKAAGLIDGVFYADELEEALKKEFKQHISLSRGYNRPTTQEDTWSSRPEIAIVVIDGAIISGSSGGSPLSDEALSGSSTIVGALERIRRDNNIKAVVVRVNSPGGSALASDLIYRELRRLAQTKPVIASMGNVAASGGYYVAAGCEEIMATPLTLTGSIGIFAGKVSLQGLAQEYGVNITTIQRGERAGAYSIFTPFTEPQKAAMTKYLVYLYRLFLRQAAETRPLSPEELDKVARGRVWTGDKAKEIKIIDETGSLIDALAKAHKLAGLDQDSAKIEVYPPPSSSLGIGLGASSQLAQFAKSHLGLPTKHDNKPRDPLYMAISAVERSALMLLNYQSGEALMLPPVVIDIQ